MRNPGYSLCHACCFAREVSGRLGQTYLLCRNETVAAKYPPQPVVECLGYEPVSISRPATGAAPASPQASRRDRDESTRGQHEHE